MTNCAIFFISRKKTFFIVFSFSSLFDDSFRPLLAAAYLTLDFAQNASNISQNDSIPNLIKQCRTTWPDSFARHFAGLPTVDIILAGLWRSHGHLLSSPHWASVNRLNSFWKVWTINLLTKVAQKFDTTFWTIMKNVILCNNHFRATCGKYLTTFYSNIWSRCQGPNALTCTQITDWPPIIISGLSSKIL